ncbi:MAG: alkaline phosphatase D family protein [Planctomycetota bacterium]
MNSQRFYSISIVFLLSLVTATSTIAQDRDPKAASQGPYLCNGVKMGDVTQTSLVVWARLGKTKSYDRQTYRLPPSDGEIKVDTITQSGDQTGVASTTGWVSVAANEDGVFETILKSLKPATKYRLNVAVRSAGSESVSDEVTTSFRTPPQPDAKTDVNFAIMTCQKFLQMDDGENGFLTYKTLASQSLDFASHTGDAVYYDQKPLLAQNALDARTHWHRMYALSNIKVFNQGVPVFMIKDDHDTLKDDCWTGQRYNDLTFQEGVEIHREQNPVGPLPYRTLRWGKHLQVWFVEGREYRTPNRKPDGPEKTILGEQQIEWLKETIPASDATFKLFVGATPLVGPDRDRKSDNHANSNFKFEGDWLRKFLADENVISINGDRHWQYVSRDPATQLWEFGTGPVLDARAQGWKQSDKRPQHRFLRVAGGYLRGSVDSRHSPVKMTLSHHDVNGNETHRETFLAN